jgi:hypothetical protein
MRIPALAILTTVTILTAAPTLAQTYSPDHPVCLQAYRLGGGYIECAYTSLAQCALSASGCAAQCIINPYLASAQVPRGTTLSAASSRLLNIILRRLVRCHPVAMDQFHRTIL